MAQLSQPLQRAFYGIVLRHCRFFPSVENCALGPVSTLHTPVCFGRKIHPLPLPILKTKDHDSRFSARLARPGAGSAAAVAPRSAPGPPALARTKGAGVREVPLLPRREKC